MSISVKRLVLRGALRGSVRLEETAEGTLAEFSLREKAGRLTAIAAGAGGFEAAELEAGRARFAAKAVCAVGLARGGRLIAVGFTGACEKERGNITARMRMLAAERTEAKKREKAPVREEEKAHAEPGAEVTEEPPAQGSSGASPVTLGILEQARRLYGMLYPKPEVERVEKKPEKAVGFNPFPKTFPGWKWEESAQGVLLGRPPEGERRAAAYPLLQAARLMRGPGRVIRAEDGRRYYLELM